MKNADPNVTTIRPWTAKNRAKSGKTGASSRRGKTKNNQSDVRPKTTENRKKDSILRLVASSGKQTAASDSTGDDSRRTSDLPGDPELAWQPWSVTEPLDDDCGKIGQISDLVFSSVMLLR